MQISESKKDDDEGIITLLPQTVTLISCEALLQMILPKTSISLSKSSKIERKERERRGQDTTLMGSIT